MKSNKITYNTLIYGGAFNPPHLGHRKIIELAVEAFDFQKILIAPSFHKIFNKEGESLTFEQRLALTKINFQNIHTNLDISDMEKNMEPPVYSFQLVSKLLENKTEQKPFVFLMGDDQIPTLPKWFKFPELCKKTDFLIANRDDANIANLQMKLMDSLSKMDLKASIQESTIKLPEINCTFHFLGNAPLEISSTEIRNSGYSLQNLHPDVMKALEEYHVND